MTESDPRVQADEVDVRGGQAPLARIPWNVVTADAVAQGRAVIDSPSDEWLRRMRDSSIKLIVRELLDATSKFMDFVETQPSERQSSLDAAMDSWERLDEALNKAGFSIIGDTSKPAADDIFAERVLNIAISGYLDLEEIRLAVPDFDTSTYVEVLLKELNFLAGFGVVVAIDALKNYNETIENLHTQQQVTARGNWDSFVAALAGATPDGPIGEILSEALGQAAPEDVERMHAMGKFARGLAGLSMAHRALQEAANEAREANVTWKDLANVLHVTHQAAIRRFDPDARQKHSDYKRKTSDD